MRCSNSWLAPRIEREKLDAYVKEDPYVVNGLVRVPEHIFDGETKVISLGVDMGHVSWTRSHNFHPVFPRDFVINLDRL